jgi:excisionase family DNA binding protein
MPQRPKDFPNAAPSVAWDGVLSSDPDFAKFEAFAREVARRLAPKRFFTIAEAVSYSGHSRSSLYEAHKRGDLIFTKFGGATRIERINLDAFLDATREDVAA